MHICPHHGCKWISRPPCIKLMNGLEFIIQTMKKAKKQTILMGNAILLHLKAAFIFKNCAYTKAVRSVELFLWWNNQLQTMK